MKFFIALLLCVITVPAFASGRLSFQLSEFSGKAGVYPLIGFSLDEKVFGPLFVTSWMGYGQRPVDGGDTKEWASGKFGVEARFKLINLGAGAFANSGSSLDGMAEDGAIENGAYAKVSLKLW